jgi:general stress protein 26
MTRTGHAQEGDRLWQIVETVNRTCKEGKGFDRLAPLLHEGVVMVLPGMGRRVEGRAACLRMLEDACSQMAFQRFDGSQQRIDVWDRTAVVTYRYDCVWDFQGRTLTDDGHEIVTFVRQGPDWRIAWRAIIPGSRQIQAHSSESAAQGAGPGMDIKEVCLRLMTTCPVCELTTLDAEGFPYTTAMNNLRCAAEYPSLVGLHGQAGSEFLLYLSTSQQSDKMARIQANPKVSAYFCDPGRVIGLMLGGTMEVVTDQALKHAVWQKGWTLYYPNGPEGPEDGVLRLAPPRVRGWCQGRGFEFTLAGV